VISETTEKQKIIPLVPLNVEFTVNGLSKFQSLLKKIRFNYSVYKTLRFLTCHRPVGINSESAALKVLSSFRVK